MNEQRKVIFTQRKETAAEDPSEITQDMYAVIADLVDYHMLPKSYADQWDMKGYRLR